MSEKWHRKRQLYTRFWFQREIDIADKPSEALSERFSQVGNGLSGREDHCQLVMAQSQFVGTIAFEESVTLLLGIVGDAIDRVNDPEIAEYGPLGNAQAVHQDRD